MKLITKELEARFLQIGNQTNEADPIVVAKFFNPTGSEEWYATEYFPGRRFCYGHVVDFGFSEWGLFSVDSLESANSSKFGCEVVRDTHFIEGRISEICPEQRDFINRLKQLQRIKNENTLSNSNEPER